MVLPRLVSNPPSNRVRYMQLKQSGYLPPKFDLITNVAKDVNDTYQRFVINEIRNYFEFPGNQIHIKVKQKS
jgi:predicted GTPase